MLDEDTVAEGLHKLGLSASGIEYVYLNLSLSVSMSQEHHCKVLLAQRFPFFEQQIVVLVKNKSRGRVVSLPVNAISFTWDF